MEAIKARAIAMSVHMERRKLERESRKDIVTDMDHVYSFIEKCSKEGHYSCAFPASKMSPQAEDELKRNGFKLSQSDSIGGPVINVDWFKIG